MFLRRPPATPQLVASGPGAKAINRWITDGYPLPSPESVKRRVLRRNGIAGATWIETGTLHGDTAAFLAQDALHVHTIEPASALVSAARERFAGRSDITVHEGTSEERLDSILASVHGPVCFWLDGHWSGGPTYLADQVTPILDELRIIATHRERLRPLVILIDDIRLFGGMASAQSGYPPFGRLLDWSAEHDFICSIEHDILVLRES